MGQIVENSYYCWSNVIPIPTMRGKFTSKLDGLTRYALIQPCYVIRDLSVDGEVPYIGLLDTGATHTMIGQQIVDRLGLSSNEFVEIYSATGITYAKKYKNLRIKLPNFSEGFLIDAICNGSYYGEDKPFNIIIGMDIIKHGDFFIKSKTKDFEFDFSAKKI